MSLFNKLFKKKKYNINDMIKGDVIFIATGVTDGEFLKGIKINGIVKQKIPYIVA